MEAGCMAVADDLWTSAQRLYSLARVASNPATEVTADLLG